MGVNHKEDRNNLFSLFIADKTRSHGLKLGSGWSSAYGPWRKLSWQAGETAVKTILRSCLLCPSPSYSSELWERLSCDKWYHYLSAVNVNLVGVSVKNDAIWLQCSTLTQNVYVPNMYFGNYNENYQDKKIKVWETRRLESDKNVPNTKKKLLPKYLDPDELCLHYVFYSVRQTFWF